MRSSSCVAIALMGGVVAACVTHESAPGPEGPPSLRPTVAAPLTVAQQEALVHVWSGDPNRYADDAEYLATGTPSTRRLSAPSVPPASKVAHPAKAKKASGQCGDEMVLVEGEYCTEVRQECAEWMDSPKLPFARCSKFAPSTCVGERVHKRFCIDRDEYTASGDSLPRNDITWIEAQKLCESTGKRLCKETEWEFACEGEQMAPYPVGLERDANRCHHDRLDLLDDKGKLRDYRKPVSELTECVSPFGVRNMTGNMDEWVNRDRTWGEYRSALKGGWWMPARNRCRPATTSHHEYYSGVQVGVRCCSDAPAK